MHAGQWGTTIGLDSRLIRYKHLPVLLPIFMLLVQCSVLLLASVSSLPVALYIILAEFRVQVFAG